jgi:predicted TIM-barrel fold metal-dependent hydrolase
MGLTAGDDLDYLDAEDMHCANLHRAGVDEWSFRSIEREISPAGERHAAYIAALTAAEPRRRRTRKPSLESQVRQLWKASKAAGVPISLTIEGGVVTASPTRGTSLNSKEVGEPDASPSRALFTARAVPKAKVVL